MALEVLLQLSLCRNVEGAFGGSPAVLHIPNRDVVVCGQQALQG